MKWKDKLINELHQHFNGDQEWTEMLITVVEKASANIHLAVFAEPFLSMMFEKAKTIESRFSVNQVAPFGQVFKGDVVIIKKSAGEIAGSFLVGEVLSFSNLNSARISELNQVYGKKIGWDIDPEFLKDKSDANFLTLMEVAKIKSCRPFATSKKDRTAWSIVKRGFQNTLFATHG